MEFRRLGSTGLKVSAVALGCGNFGGIGSAPEFWGKGESREDAFRLMDHAWDLGVRLFDTADAYGGGESESAIGAWLATKPAAVRDQLLVSSKVFNPVDSGPNDRGLSRRHILRQIDRSLQRLGVERLDLYLIHEPDPETPLEETLGALSDLVHAGKVHYLGASNIEAWRLARSLWLSDKLGLERFHWVQNSYSLLDRDAERELFPLCRDQGLGFTPFSPLAGGWLSGKYQEGRPYPRGSRMTLRPEPYEAYLNPATYGALNQFRDAARERGVDMATLALAWVLGRPGVSSVIVGPRRPQHLEAVRRALELPLSRDEGDELARLFCAGPR